MSNTHTTRIALALLLGLGFGASGLRASEELEVRIFRKEGPAGSGTILLPRSDLRKLSQATAIVETATPLASCRLQEASYRIVPGYPASAVEARYRVRCEGPGWKSIELAGRKASMLIPPTASGAMLLPQGEPGSFLIDATGTVEIVQQLSAPVSKDGNRFRMTLSVPLVPVNRIALANAPAPYRDYRIQPGVLDPAARAGVFPPTESVTLEWSNAQPAAARAGARESLAAARSQVKAIWHLIGRMSDRSIRFDAGLALDLGPRPVLRTAIDLPAGLAAVDVRSPSLADWSVESGPAGQRLTVEWKSPSTGPLHLQIVLEATRESEAPFAIGLPAVAGATSELLWLGLLAPGHIDAEAKSVPDGLRQLDLDRAPREIRGTAQQPLTLLFSASRNGGLGLAVSSSLLVDATRHEQVKVLTAVCDLAEVFTHVLPDGSSLGKSRYLIKNNAEQFLKLALPAGARVLSAFVSGVAVQPARGAAAELLVPLEKSGVQNTQAAAFSVEVTWLETFKPLTEGDTVRFDLPSVHLPVSTLRWKLSMPRDLEARAVRTNLTADLAYREVAYAGEGGERDAQARGARLFEKTAPPLLVPFPDMSQVDNYSQDILEPGSATPFLEARVVARQTSRPQRTLAFGVAMLIAFWLVLAGATHRSRRIRSVVLLVVSGTAVGVTSFRPELLSLGLYFALGLFLGVAIALARWAADWRGSAATPGRPRTQPEPASPPPDGSASPA